MPIKTANDLFLHELSEIYDAERQLSSVLPELCDKVPDQEIRQCLQARQQQGQQLLGSVDQILEQFKFSRDGVTNHAMQGLISETRELADSIPADLVRECALIASIQKIEHYCIAAWGTAAAVGRALECEPAVNAFERALDEGKMLDKRMTELAEQEVNPKIVQ